MKHILSLLVALLVAIGAHAQVGYQVALMDQSTGKPRANETVSVTVTITDNAGAVICNETTSATTNQFGMLALQVGNATTFDAVDWSKTPLWVSATVGGITIGKTQLLNVPVAEHAKHWGQLTPEILASKSWEDRYGTKLVFNRSGSCSIVDDEVARYSYSISGNTVSLYGNSGNPDCQVYIYLPDINALSRDDRPIFR